MDLTWAKRNAVRFWRQYLEERDNRKLSRTQKIHKPLTISDYVKCCLQRKPVNIIASEPEC